MNHRETQIHIAIVHWIKTVSPSTICLHVPNGGLRSKREAAKLKAMGVLPGVPDLILICEAPGPCVAFLEVKAAKGTLSEGQKAFQARLCELRVPFAVVRSIDDVRIVFRQWLVPSREAMAGVAA